LRKHSDSRRRFLRTGTALVSAPLLSLPKRARAGAPRTLSFRHTHTGETLSIAYAAGEMYLDAALGRINWLLRDFRNGRAHPIDPRLLDQLHALSQVTRSSAPFEVISGFRSPATNEMLRKTGGGGVASRSLHLDGRAVDIRLADVPLADLREAALSLRAGGVGFYPQPQFVHIDTGRVRRW
jgi:uncharacterized protein YcbK (DUF882 family)